MRNKQRIFPFIVGTLDILVLVFVVYLPVVFRDVLIPFNTYFALLFTVWLIISIASGKYQFKHRRLKNELMAILINAISVWGLISLYVISLEKFNKNYNVLYRQILIVVLIELLFRIIYYLLNKRSYSHTKTSFFTHLGLRDKKWILMFLDLLSVFVAFMIVVWVKPATIRIYIPNYFKFLVGLLIWEFIINLLTQKHNIKGKERYRDYLIPILRSNVITIILLAIFIYLFRLFNFSRLIIFGTVLLSTFFECLFVGYIGVHTRIRHNMDQSERILGVTALDKKPPREDNCQPLSLKDLPEDALTVEEGISEGLYNCCPELKGIIAQHMNLKGIHQNNTTILDTKTLFNIDNLKSNSQTLFINKHKVNDFKRINDYFRLLNEKIEMGGYIVGCGETISGVYHRFLKQYSRPTGMFLYFFHFIFRRVFPKLPGTREIDYVLTGGKNRAMSKTEILGRAVYCGFKIIDTFMVNDLMYFIAAKVNTPYEKENPSYGPFISLKRIGKHGKMIKIYKFRTMHPYSEYIQDYVFEKNHLANGGKLKNDFRVTGWGRVFRKLWIDELPQFINFMRGDIKLVGVRALSLHYFSLYPKEFQTYRIKYKPGLLPPYYVDLPDTMEEIVASEKKYLDAYSKYKFLVDIKYGAIVFFNIIFRGKRSS